MGVIAENLRRLLKASRHEERQGYVRTIRKKIGHDRLLLVGSGVFICKDGRFLLQRRRDNHLWADHGGCVEIGETPQEAASRELLEETGLTAGKLELLGIYSGEEMFHTYPNGDRVYIVAAYWLCEDFEGEPLDETDETSELQWFALDKIPEDVT
ncbi:MAG: NUDIX domain-containing protein, partial [Oscillospiraceae bacterium]|nr:NUDIX domain-containing protein [Oscillospiraceae bacterium]